MGAHLRDAARNWTWGATRGNGVELMSVHKRKYDSGKVVWFYQFSLPGATRKQRNRIIETGFATKKEASDAETARRIEEKQKRDLAEAGAPVASQMLDSGVPLPVVSARLGHSSIRTTAEIYSHAIHGQDDEATRKWEEYQQRNRLNNQPAHGVQ
jgi:integrase